MNFYQRMAKVEKTDLFKNHRFIHFLFTTLFADTEQKLEHPALQLALKQSGNSHLRSLSLRHMDISAT